MRRSAVEATAALVLTVSLAALAVASSPAPPVENPHGAFRDDCSLCHGPRAWKPARISKQFDHGGFGFALTGAHAAATCTACHRTLDFTMEQSVCATCHEDVHRGEFGTDCAQCHTTRSFIDRSGMVRLHQTTRFPLSGAHAAIDCERCHAGAAAGQMAFVGIAAECESCHMRDYNATTNPAHAAAGFPLDCTSCHNSFAWTDARFDHGATAFPLTGAHRTALCQSCHGDGVWAGKPTACFACHQADYDGTVSPNHTALAYSTECATCHSTASWEGATFDHNTTAFPLTGAHVSVSCVGCHGDGVYAGKSTTCVSCHQGDYDGTTGPNHASLGYSTACETCHSTASWSGATFDHNTTAFPLTGAHLSAACLDCHGDGVYAGKSTACVSCHQSDYDGTTDPNHAALAFSTDCATCHTTVAWSGATFDHDTSFFPIYSGRHAGIWTSCATCHTQPSNYSVFTCLSCHPHDSKTQTDSNHGGVSGYVYESNACYSCHPRGRVG
jgi:hypothetical protein